MKLEVSFKNLRPRNEIRTRAENLFRKLERFLDRAAESHLTVAVEHSDAVLELVVSAHGDTHKATEEHADLRTALDKVFHTMENQLRRSKERRASRRRDVESTDGFGAAS